MFDTAAYNITGLSSRIDSLGRQLTTRVLTRYSNKWDSLWSTTFEMYNLKGSYASVPPIMPDGYDGIFFYGALFDTANVPHTQIQRVTKEGRMWDEEGAIIKNKWGLYPFSSKGRIGFVTDLFSAQVVDTNKTYLWADTFKVIGDYDNTFFARAVSDKNGGAIVSFWTVAGGIKVQHTGRVGKVGVLTNIIDNKKSVAESFELSQNYPNPFNPVTTINDALPQDGMVTLKIYDALGRETSTLVKEYKQSGRYTVSFSAIGGSASGGDATGLSSGVYFYKLVSGKFTAIRKMILIK